MNLIYIYIGLDILVRNVYFTKVLILLSIRNVELKFLSRALGVNRYSKLLCLPDDILTILLNGWMSTETLGLDIASYLFPFRD